MAALASAAGAARANAASASTSPPACSLYTSPDGLYRNTGLTPSDPLPLRVATNTATAGQTLCFEAGTYPLTDTLYLQHSGEKGSAITYRGGYNGAAILKWAGTPGGGVLAEIVSGTHDIQIQNLVFDGRNGTALARVGIKCDQDAYDIAVRLNIVKFTGAGGINSTGCDYLTILKNKVFHTGYDTADGWSSAISFNQNSWHDLNPGFHSYVIGNVVSGASDESLARTHPFTEGHAFISDRGGVVPPVLVANNIFFENGRWCVNVYGTENNWIVNNTCYADGLDGRVGPAGEFINHSSAVAVAQHNHFINNVAIAWNNRYTYKLVTGSHAVYQTNVGWGGAGAALPPLIKNDPTMIQQADPTLTDPFTLDPTADHQQAFAPPPWLIGTRFVPLAGSPLIDSGIDPRFARGMTPALRKGITRFLLTDFANAPRPQGAGFDIGAYEVAPG